MMVHRYERLKLAQRPASSLVESNPARPLVRPVESKRTFEEILDQLEENIVAGRLSPGDRLPTERELAQQFQVSRTSVREAMRVLETLGLVRVRRGAENGAELLSQPGNAFSHLFRLLVALRHVRVEELLELWVMIEMWSAGAAAARQPHETLAELERIVDGMEPETLTPDEFQHLDSEFHTALIAAAGNDLLPLFLESVRDEVQQANLPETMTEAEWRRLREELAVEHRGLLRTIRSGDRDQAANQMRDHIEKWGQRAIARGHA